MIISLRQIDAQNLPKENTMITVSKFNVRIVNKGDMYSRNFCLMHNDERPMIEFYDSRYPHTKFGQFVSRYYVGTLLDHDGGLCLDGGNPDEWSVNAKDMKTVRNYISGVAA